MAEVIELKQEEVVALADGLDNFKELEDCDLDELKDKIDRLWTGATLQLEGMGRGCSTD